MSTEVPYAANEDGMKVTASELDKEEGVPCLKMCTQRKWPGRMHTFQPVRSQGCIQQLWLLLQRKVRRSTQKLQDTCRSHPQNLSFKRDKIQAQYTPVIPAL